MIQKLKETYGEKLEREEVDDLKKNISKEDIKNTMKMILFLERFKEEKEGESERNVWKLKESNFYELEFLNNFPFQIVKELKNKFSLQFDSEKKILYFQNFDLKNLILQKRNSINKKNLFDYTLIFKNILPFLVNIYKENTPFLSLDQLDQATKKKKMYKKK